MYTLVEIDKMFETDVSDISLDEIEREIELKEIIEEESKNKNRENNGFFLK